MPIAKLTRKNHPVQYKFFPDFNKLADYVAENKQIDVTPIIGFNKNFDKEVDYKLMRKISYGKHFTYSDMKMAERIAGKIKGFHRLTNEERLFVTEWREAKLEEEGVLV